MARKKELTYEEIVKKEEQDIKKLEKEVELEKLRKKKAELKWQSRKMKFEKVKEDVKSVGGILNTFFKGVPALGVDLKPIKKKK